MRGNSLAPIVLALSALPGARGQQDARPSSTIALEAALDRLPRIDEERSWNAAREAWDIPTAVSWMAEYVAAGGTLTDEQWRRALTRSQAIRVRERWPAGEPFAVGMDVPSWLPLTEIRLDPERTTLSSARAGSTVGGWCGNWFNAVRSRWRYQELGRLEPGLQELRFRVVVERGSPRSSARRRDRDSPPAVLWTGSLAFQIEVVPTLADVLPAAHGAELDAEVRNMLHTGLVYPTFLYVYADYEQVPSLSTMSVSLELALLDGEVLQGMETLVPVPRPVVSESVGWELPAFPAYDSHWLIRVRGRGKDALRNWDATRYWDGEFTIALRDEEWW